MGRVLLPEGTAPSAHIPGIDIAGKTGSAQVVSLDTRKKHNNNAAFAQNGWFVGFTPRRNPEIIVVVLFEGGEHGKLAARIATQVIKAYVDKQRRQGIRTVGIDPGKKQFEMAGLWTAPGDGHDRDSEDALQGGRFTVKLAAKPPKAAKGVRFARVPATLAAGVTH
jgi:penicillin-binding protein 2